MVSDETEEEFGEENRPAKKKPGRPAINYMELANKFFDLYWVKDIGGEQKDILVRWGGAFYDWKDGSYRETDPDILDAYAITFLKQSIGATKNKVSELLFNLYDKTVLSSARVLNTWKSDTDVLAMQIPLDTIAVNNGLLFFDSQGNPTIRPHTPDFFSLTKLPYDYDPSAECPLWEKFVSECVCGDEGKIRLLKQWAGYLLMPENIHQRYMLLRGEGATGKSTFCDLMMEMLGQINCSGVPIGQIASNFGLSLTFGKKLNVSGDIEEELNPSAEILIKQWTGDDHMYFNWKYGRNLTAKHTAKLMITANEVPNLRDKSDGTWRRLIVVLFDRPNFRERDPHLKGRLKTELSGILNWALAGKMDLLLQGAFTVPSNCTADGEAIKRAANPARIFLSDNYGYDFNRPVGTETSMIYSAYRKWCMVNGYRPLSDGSFGKEVTKEFPKMERKRWCIDGKRRYTYGGVVQLRARNLGD